MDNDQSTDKLAIREVVENWVMWRDAGDWERAWKGATPVIFERLIELLPGTFRIGLG